MKDFKQNVFVKKLFLFVIFFVCVFSLTTVNESNAYAQPFDEKRVLFISSYSSAFSTFYDQIEGIEDVFDGYPVTVDMEFMDSKRFFTDENLTNFYNNLTYKLDQVDPYDLILVSDDNGLDFVMDYQDELFQNIPIVFLGINNQTKAQLYSSNPYVTGVSESVSMYETIKLALDMNPSYDKIVALTDVTPTGQADLQTYYEQESNFPDVGFLDLDMSELTWDDFLIEVENIDENSVVLLLAAYTDKEGTHKVFDDSLCMICEKTNQPIYHLYEHGIGGGVLGGKVVSHFDQGKTAAEIALSIFNGTDISEIELIENSPNVYMIDYQLLKDFGYNENLLPEDTVFINRELSFYQENRTYVLIASGFLIVQTGIIVLLVWSVMNRGKSNRELLKSHIELKEKEQRIQDLVYKDTLTSLNNRIAINEYMDRVIDDPNTNSLWLLFMDVDNFKYINDKFGHDTGDLFITSIGHKLLELDETDVEIGRFGGDEFIVAIKNKTYSEVEAIAQTIGLLFADEVTIKDYSFFLSTSIGLACFPEDGKTVEELIKKADIALYEAKDLGKNRIVRYYDEMNENFLDKLNFQQLIREAFKNNDFYLNFQPVVNTKEDSVYAYEALIRWKSEILGQVSPSRLIQEAEEIGLIIEMGKMVLEEAARFSIEINKKSSNPVVVAVNISAVQLLFNGFENQLLEIIRVTGAEPANICLEMTETILVKNITQGVRVFDQLRKHGFKVGLDDFGIGYSSLNYLKNLNLDVLKIDKAFIKTIVNSTYDKYIVEALVKIAREKNLTLIAEGVELTDQLEKLNNLECYFIQGYYFSKPISRKDALEYKPIKK